MSLDGMAAGFQVQSNVARRATKVAALRQNRSLRGSCVAGTAMGLSRRRRLPSLNLPGLESQTAALTQRQKLTARRSVVKTVQTAAIMERCGKETTVPIADRAAAYE
eukprot:CAMPEP_0117662412 /NCGR_PEP_ID=MMETSP0804-20121206/8040_1 /TAXON_ID=1074897 /ORGANISM="Tetraselmis astigmatica, Strain CCMP880" /LENGTH=106 /DNA_ID=CAMNT_0005469311 /DNA_START=1328 /DNA_END=1652 /DNA_ORIENTATION=+